jgi:hypothetical protein
MALSKCEENAWGTCECQLKLALLVPKSERNACAFMFFLSFKPIQGKKTGISNFLGYGPK